MDHHTFTSGYYYLASTYTQHPEGFEKAAEQAAEQTSLFARAGIAVLSPIAHGHALTQSEHGRELPLTHDFWLPYDEAFMRGAKGLLFIKMDGWEKSIGMHYEYGFFRGMERTTIVTDPVTTLEEAASVVAYATSLEPTPPPYCPPPRRSR